jgi:hypothetical protein
MKTIPFLPTLLRAAALAVVCLGSAHAEQTEVAAIKFSDPSKPGTLRLAVSNGDITIRGVDSDEITVRSEMKKETTAPRPDGLRVLSTSSSYSLTEKDNVINLSFGAGHSSRGNGDFDISVPRTTNVVIASSFGGDIQVSDVGGDIEVKTLNGEVKLAGVTGGALVETMNGEVDVSVKAMAENKPLVFTSMNGELTLTLPVDAKANVQLRTQNGTILTDFDEQQLVTKTASLARSSLPRYGQHDQTVNTEIRETVREAVRAGMDAAREATRAAREAIREANGELGEDGISIPIPPIPPLPPMTGGKIVTGTLNGGGTDIRISTMNGEVTLRKAK